MHWGISQASFLIFKALHEANGPPPPLGAEALNHMARPLVVVAKIFVSFMLSYRVTRSALNYCPKVPKYLYGRISGSLEVPLRV